MNSSSIPGPNNLGGSARASLLWGGGFTLLRDVAQFGVMLILVRILAPADYGTAVLVQAILGVVAAVSFQTFSSHALQIRNPEEIDWQAHFTTAVVLNTVLAGLVLLLAFGVSFSPRYREVALPLAALSVVFLIEIPGTLRHRMLEANHDWKRFRLLLIIGTFLGLGVGLAVGLMGGGVWALIVQVPMLGIPAAVDLFVSGRFRPDWSWSWARYRDTALFGLSRLGAGLVGRLRMLVENGVMAAAYDLATLGIFSRAMGLANLLVGRIGGVTMASLYPVVTRADRGSERFQRLAGLVLRGVAWTTIPFATFLAMSSADTVQLLYGSRWGDVVPLVVLAAGVTALTGMAGALGSLLLANDETGAAFWLECAGSICGILIAVVFIPYGPGTYLVALAGLGALILAVTMILLVRTSGMTLTWGLSALIPACVAAVAGAATLIVLHRGFGTFGSLWLRLPIDAIVFGLAYTATLRLAYHALLAEIVDVMPGRTSLARALCLPDLPR